MTLAHALHTSTCAATLASSPPLATAASRSASGHSTWVRVRYLPMSEDDKPGFDRRTFLRGTAGGAAVTGLLTLSGKASAAKTPVLGPNAVPIKLNVNG